MDGLGSNISAIDDQRAPNISNPDEADRILGPDPVVSSENDFVCPIEEPFYNGFECMQCTEIFNSYTGGCVRCPDGTVWNQTSDMCEVGEPEPEAEKVSNLTSSGNWASEFPTEAE